MKKHIANIITGCRISGSILMLFFPVFSRGFQIAYIACGFSDMVDGTIARKTNSASPFGERLDTIADLVFVIASAVKWIPAIYLPEWIWMWAAVIACIRAGNILRGWTAGGGFAIPHTVWNKAAGIALFLFPLTVSFVEPVYSAAAVCLIALAAAIHEGVCVGKKG